MASVYMGAGASVTPSFEQLQAAVTALMANANRLAPTGMQFVVRGDVAYLAHVAPDGEETRLSADFPLSEVPLRGFHPGVAIDCRPKHGREGRARPPRKPFEALRGSRW